MKHKILTYSITILAAFVGVSCDSFLDELPDNRTVLDDKDKIQKILSSAYPTSSYNLMAELSTDNILDMGDTNPNSERIYDQTAYWEVSTETDNDDLKDAWEGAYGAIANANQALDGIKKLGNPESLNAQRGEGLVARAYSHFVLVNLFSKHYNPATAATDLGIPYLSAPETKLSPKYERGNVKEVYEKIEKDLLEGLPLIDDSQYEVVKYHFNRAAAHAFAARFYLYYQKWDKAIEHATQVLTANPSTILRNWKAISQLPRKVDVVSKDFIQADNKANLLLIPDGSNIGLYFGPYYLGSRMAHTRGIARFETTEAQGPWGNTGTTTFWFQPFNYSANNLDKSIVPKMPFIFQFTDIVAQIGYRQTVIPTFTTDETLLVRAEAYIHKKDYDKAEADLKAFTKNYLRSGEEVSRAKIQDFYTNLPYTEDDAVTQKKKLHPAFNIEVGEQENFIHCVLQYRRLLTLHEGLRWFDIRRYGIEVPRYKITPTGTIVADRLTKDDLRRTFQVPDDVIKAGLTPNPR
ncbi:RagB/SusD family nutrient uptake outer membrane protein [Capnocytophaga canimorsus]|uniref:RagB/SusD family nutrient uptake outer membrane protein n=1 Tax=Capnocytophaga canimorsus TaxID=28188 RepID=UPI00385AA97D